MSLFFSIFGKVRIYYKFCAVNCERRHESSDKNGMIKASTTITINIIHSNNDDDDNDNNNDKKNIQLKGFYY